MRENKTSRSGFSARDDEHRDRDLRGARGGRDVPRSGAAEAPEGAARSSRGEGVIAETTSMPIHDSSFNSVGTSMAKGSSACAAAGRSTRCMSRAALWKREVWRRWPRRPGRPEPT